MAPQTVVTKQRRSGLLLAAAAAAVVAGRSFVAPQGEGKQIVASRREVMRWMPAAAAVGGAAPSFGASGVTKAWGTRPDGDEDTLHTGGVEWEDIKVGTGATPKVGQLVAINFKATADLKEREVTVEDTKGTAKDFRFGIGQMLPGMDEGVMGMRTGGKRRMKIPGELAFGPKAVPAAIGRPSIPSFTPLEVEVTLEFIPGADSVYEYGQEDEK